jgi:hypothetical protein
MAIVPMKLVLDFDTLETDPTPTFLIKATSEAVELEILFANEAFRVSRLRDRVYSSRRDALLFRGWTQAVDLFKKQYDFAGWIWNASRAGRQGTWKVVQAIRHAAEGDKGPASPKRVSPGQLCFKDDFVLASARYAPPLPAANLTARWQTMHTIMELSDVGIFEYTPAGSLIYANEAWYRLRYSRLLAQKGLADA